MPVTFMFNLAITMIVAVWLTTEFWPRPRMSILDFPVAAVLQPPHRDVPLPAVNWGEHAAPVCRYGLYVIADLREDSDREDPTVIEVPMGDLYLV